MSQEDKYVVELSKLCSDTANDLVKELGKFKLDSRHGLRQTLKKGIQSRWKGKFDEIQKKLEKYQKILDTRILAWLQASSIKHTEAFNALEKNVQGLLNSFRQGQGIFDQHLTDQGKITREHVDRQLESYNQASRDRLEQQTLKQRLLESLFFPEILSRKEQIADAHRGTCSWIFGPPKSNDTGHGKIDDDICELDDDEERYSKDFEARGNEQAAELADNDEEENNGDKYAKSSRSSVSTQPWPDFLDWLEHGQGVYWMNGKPGSGKSTLMSYLTGHKRTVKALETWANGSDLLIPSFFFWNLGTALQKSSQGLLRSLLYQIVDHPKSEFLPMAKSQMRTMHAWTERALLSEVNDYLKRKPASLSLCFFIDGLDEFVGEQDTLLQSIKLLEATPRVKVCVSSRPEQVFIRAFRDAPQLRLQDFNHRDMTKTSKDKLYPALKAYRLREEKEVQTLIASIVNRAEGVFLWFQIVVKDLIKGAQNHDTMQMLHVRLQRMPNTIENLYDHMLANQDSLYQQEATTYFHILARLDDFATLLLFIFMNNDNGAWDHVLANEYAFFESEEVDTLCERLETRIRTCCMGLVEIDRDSRSYFPNLGLVHISVRYPIPPSKLAHQLRQVRFIHRSVLDYLNHREFFQDYDLDAADLNLARCLVGFLGIIPILVFDDRGRQELLDAIVWEAMDVASSLDKRSSGKAVGRAMENPAYSLVAQIDLVAQQVNIRMNATERSWYKSFFHLGLNSRTHPFFDYLSGLATFFGLYNYVSHHLSSHHPPPEVLNCLLVCAVTGLRRFLYPQIGINGSELATKGERGLRSFLSDGPIVGNFRVIGTLLRQGAKPDSISYILLREYDDSDKLKYQYKVSAWASFLMNTFQNKDDKLDSVVCRQWLRLWIDVVRSFVLNDAEVNTSVFTNIRFQGSGFSTVIVDLEESPLSLIYRKTVYRANDHFEELCNLLQSRGGSEYRRCRLLRFFFWDDDDVKKYEIYQVSQTLSDHLLGHILESSIDSRESFFQEVLASLTEADMIRDSQPIILESSAPHTSKQNETEISKTVQKCSNELDEEGKDQVTG